MIADFVLFAMVSCTAFFIKPMEIEHRRCCVYVQTMCWEDSFLYGPPNPRCQDTVRAADTCREILEGELWPDPYPLRGEDR